MREDSFSRRHGLDPVNIPITVRYEAPQWLRDFIGSAAQNANMGIGDLREILCYRLLESPDPGNWSTENIEHEVRSLLRKAEWFHVYDFCEDVAEWLKFRGKEEEFSRKLNEAFRRKGIGWQFVEGNIETRGEESFESTVRSAIKTTTEMGKPVAERELHESLLDLSKRPNPDITGAIQHAMAALECVARDVAGDEKATLGDLLKKNPDLLPPPLDIALSKIWGFTSERGRHLRENDAPAIEEAELVVSLTGTLVTYLLKKSSNIALP
ncbi:MAG: AbiJ-NTD4 domain-containing protein [Terrimicrobiaceae bacterium]